MVSFLPLSVVSLSLSAIILSQRSHWSLSYFKIKPHLTRRKMNNAGIQVRENLWHSRVHTHSKVFKLDGSSKRKIAPLAIKFNCVWYILIDWNNAACNVKHSCSIFTVNWAHKSFHKVYNRMINYIIARTKFKINSLNKIKGKMR